LAAAELLGPRHKGRPKLEEAAEIERAIRAAAITTLLDHGEGATLNAVAQAAGLSRKSVYARYANKAELFIAVIRDLLTRATSVEFDVTGSIEQRLLNYIRAALAMITKPSSLIIQRLLTDDPVYIATLKCEMQNATHKQFFEPLRALLLQGNASGELVVDDVDATTRVLIKLILAECVMPNRDVPPWQTDEELDAYVRFMVNLIFLGLRPRGTAAPGPMAI
jgi:AcrR family transcriptional regulator